MPDNSQASDILLKFKVFPPKPTAQIDDAVVVENDQVQQRDIFLAKNYEKGFYHPKK